MSGRRLDRRLRSGIDRRGFFPGTGTGSWVDDGQAEFVITVHNGAGDVEVSRG